MFIGLVILATYNVYMNYGLYLSNYEKHDIDVFFHLQIVYLTDKLKFRI
jgi:hypothetical protein